MLFFFATEYSLFHFWRIFRSRSNCDRRWSMYCIERITHLRNSIRYIWLIFSHICSNNKGTLHMFHDFKENCRITMEFMCDVSVFDIYFTGKIGFKSLFKEKIVNASFWLIENDQAFWHRFLSKQRTCTKYSIKCSFLLQKAQ
jgi:hypothetical protein